MIASTASLVLRSIPYGDTSLVSTQFTRTFGVQAYLVQGVRSSKQGRSSRAGLLQPTMLLDITAYHKSQGNLQRLKEFTPRQYYRSILDDVVKNSIALFSVELLLRLLPEDAPMPELYDFAEQYLLELDQRGKEELGNYPLFFVLQCSRYLGYEPGGNWSEATPYLNLAEGGFQASAPSEGTSVTIDDAALLQRLMEVRNFSRISEVAMSGAARFRLLEWYILFLQRHTEHMRGLKSLPVLQAVLRDGF
jgi:DNA repair protein RecO (recombination protein O)